MEILETNQNNRLNKVQDDGSQKAAASVVLGWKEESLEMRARSLGARWPPQRTAEEAGGRRVLPIGAAGQLRLGAQAQQQQPWQG